MKYCSDENRVEILAGRGVITVLHTQLQRDKVHITLHLNLLHSLEIILFFGLSHKLFLVMLQSQIIMIILMDNNLLV